MARVLVAESDGRARHFLQQALELGDHEVTVVGSGTDAIHLLGCRPFDVLITDHQLHAASGVDVIGTAHRMDPDLCCLILAGPTDAEVTIAALRVPGGAALSRKEIDDYTALVARYGPRVPLIIGPAIAALGFVLFASLRVWLA